MKAVRIAAPQEIGVAEIEKPVIKADEVLLKIKYVGFCGSDLNTYMGHRTKRFFQWSGKMGERF